MTARKLKVIQESLVQPSTRNLAEPETIKVVCLLSFQMCFETYRLTTCVGAALQL